MNNIQTDGHLMNSSGQTHFEKKKKHLNVHLINYLTPRSNLKTTLVNVIKWSFMILFHL